MLQKIRKKKILLQGLFIIFGALAVVIAIYAWEPPSSSPPEADLNALLDASETHQVKSGPLSVTTLYDTNDATYFIDPSGIVSAILSGSVGIGTTNPSAKLEVKSSSDEIFRLTREGASYPVKFRVGTDGALVVNANNEDIFVLKNGNVGIGTTNPSKKLYVAGNIHATGDICTDTGCLNTLSGYWVKSDSNLYTSLNVGIGIKNPNFPLVVVPAIRAASDSSGEKFIQIQHNGDNAGIIWNSGSLEIDYFLHPGPPIVLITTTPTTTLYINGDTKIEGDLEVTGKTEIIKDVANAQLLKVVNNASNGQAIRAESTYSSAVSAYSKNDVGVWTKGGLIGIWAIAGDSDAYAGVFSGGKGVKIEGDLEVSGNTTISGNLKGTGDLIGWKDIVANYKAKIESYDTNPNNDKVDTTELLTAANDWKAGKTSEKVLNIMSLLWKHDLSISGLPGNIGVDNYNVFASNDDALYSGYFIGGKGVKIEGDLEVSGNTTIQGELCLGGECHSNWPSTPSTYWNLSGSSLYPSSTNWNVGIGTTNPSAKLEVKSSSDEIFRLTREGASYPVKFRVGTDSALVVNADNEDIFVLKNGNVGIGTTNPSEKLDVAGNAKIEGDLEVTGSIVGTNKETVTKAITGKFIDPYFNTHEVWVEGYLGAGEAGVYGISHKNDLYAGFFSGGKGVKIEGDLEVSGKTEIIKDVINDYLLKVVNNASNGQAIRAESTYSSAVSAYSKNDVGVWTKGGLIGIWAIAGDSDAYAGVFSGGKGVKIEGDLEVSGNTTIQGELCLGGECHSNWPSTPSTYWNLSGSSLYPSSTDWNVGIGTTNPSAKLEVKSSSDEIFRLTREGASYPVKFRVGTDSALVVNADNEDIFVLKNGNVGIGTTVPKEKLHVAGNTKIKGNLNVSGKTEIVEDVKDAYLLKVTNNALNGGGIRAESKYSSAVSAYSENNIGLWTKGGLIGILAITDNSDAYAGVFSGGKGVKIEGDLEVSGNTTIQGELCLGGECHSNWPSTPSTYWNLSGSSLYPSSTNWNVGIGTTNPSAKLEVKSSSDEIFRLTREGASYPVKFRVGTDSALVVNVSDRDVLTIKDERIGINLKKPEFPLDVVNGSIHIGKEPASKLGLHSLVIGDYGATSITGGEFGLTDYSWLAATSCRAYVLNGIRTDGDIIVETGGVGIGVSSIPTDKKLYVAGDAKIEGNLEVTGPIQVSHSDTRNQTKIGWVALDVFTSPDCNADARGQIKIIENTSCNRDSLCYCGKFEDDEHEPGYYWICLVSCN